MPSYPCRKCNVRHTTTEVWVACPRCGTRFSNAPMPPVEHHQLSDRDKAALARMYGPNGEKAPKGPIRPAVARRLIGEAVRCHSMQGGFGTEGWPGARAALLANLLNWLDDIDAKAELLGRILSVLEQERKGRRETLDEPHWWNESNQPEGA